MQYTFIIITLKSLWPEVIVPVRVQSMDQIELFNHLLYLKPSKRQVIGFEIGLLVLDLVLEII